MTSLATGVDSSTHSATVLRPRDTRGLARVSFDEGNGPFDAAVRATVGALVTQPRGNARTLEDPGPSVGNVPPLATDR